MRLEKQVRTIKVDRNIDENKSTKVVREVIGDDVQLPSPDSYKLKR